jgi:hypothetical protein
MFFSGAAIINVKSLKWKLNVKVTVAPGWALVSHSVKRHCALSIVLFLLAIAFSVSYIRIALLIPKNNS